MLRFSRSVGISGEWVQASWARVGREAGYLSLGSGEPFTVQEFEDVVPSDPTSFHFHLHEFDFEIRNDSS
jgi:hypothetical protein